MNLPNKLSLTRVCLIPLLVLLLCLPSPACRWAALVVFCIASFTDYLDGHIARKNKIVTNFGKFIDPVADKLLVLSTMVTLCGLGEFPAWAVVLVLFRELAVDGLRLIACEQGKVIAAGKLGKIKTVTQMILLIYCLARIDTWLPAPAGNVIRWVLIGIVAFMTLLSGTDYFVRNRALFAGGMK